MAEDIPPSDRIDAERLIRTMALTLANGAPIKDIDELARRNAGRLTHADIQSGRVSSDVVGDIINTVEQAKGAPATFNWSAATPEQVAAYLRWNGLDPSAMGMREHAAMRMAGASGGSGNSGARFDDIGSAVANGNWSSEAGQSYMRSYAVQHGVPWAANNPELLKLGPSAIDTFAKVNMQKETYEKLTKKIGFNAREAADDTKYYLDHGGDPKKHKGHVDELEKNLNDLTGGDQKSMAQAREALRTFRQSTGDDAAKKSFHDSLDKIVGDDENKKKGAIALEKQYGTLADHALKKEANAQVRTASATTAQGNRDNTLAALNDKTDDAPKAASAQVTAKRPAEARTSVGQTVKLTR